MRRLRGVLLAWSLCCAALGCGDDDRNTGPTVPTDGNDAGDSPTGCVDRDGDGYGRRCTLGSDCDDDDPEITDECRRCIRVTKDCPCELGTPQERCDPPDQRVDGGTLVCSEGTRYCRGGYWSDCEVIGQYVFVADK